MSTSTRVIPGSRAFSKSYVQYRTVLLVPWLGCLGVVSALKVLVFTTGNFHCDNHNAPEGFPVQVDGVLCSADIMFTRPIRLRTLNNQEIEVLGDARK